MRDLLRRFAVPVILLAIALWTPGFLSWPSILSLLTTVAFVGCVGVGMTLITLSGNIMSFSLGATLGASAMVFVVMTNVVGLFAGAILALVFGGLVSGLQGAVVGFLRANPIIISIASLSLVYGASEALAESGTVYLGSGIDAAFLKGAVHGVPVEFIVLVCLALIGQGLLSFTTVGRHILMVGSSLRAAEAVGVRIGRTVTGAYVWAGMCAALAGIMLALRYDSASMTYGIGYDYDAIAGVLVGGTAIKGGQGSVLRTLLGALMIALIQVVLLLQGFRPEWQYLISGLVVLAVMLLQSKGQRDAT